MPVCIATTTAPYLRYGCVPHRTCWFTQVSLGEGGVAAAGAHTSHGTTSPATTLLALERTIQERREALAAGPAAPDEKPSWTAKLLTNPELLCKKVGTLWH